MAPEAEHVLTFMTAAALRSRRSRAGANPASGGTAWLVAVFPARIGTLVTGALSGRFASAVADGLTAAGQLVVTRTKVDMTLLRFPLWETCTVATCLSGILGAMGADLAVRIQVDRTGDNYVLALTVRDAKALLLWKGQSRCDICTLNDVIRAAKTLGGKAGKALGLKPVAKPPRPAASVECFADADCGKDQHCAKGRCLAGAAPPARPPARKARSARKPLARKGARKGARKPGKMAAHKIRRPPAWKKPPPWGTFAIATGGFSLATVLTGIVLLAIDGKPTCSKSNARYRCPERYATKGAGVAFTALGVAAAVGGGVLTYFWWRHR